MGEELRNELFAVGLKEVAISGGAEVGLFVAEVGYEAQEGVAKGYADGGGTGIVVGHGMA